MQLTKERYFFGCPAASYIDRQDELLEGFFRRVWVCGPRRLPAGLFQDLGAPAEPRAQPHHLPARRRPPLRNIHDCLRDGGAGVQSIECGEVSRPSAANARTISEASRTLNPKTRKP